MGNYLEIEQVRFGERLRVRVGMDSGLGPRSRAPLLLQPLVENAVRHGIALCLGGRHDRWRPGAVATWCGSGHQSERWRVHAARYPGFGLDIVRRRLSGAFGTRGALGGGAVADRISRVDYLADLSAVVQGSKPGMSELQVPLRVVIVDDEERRDWRCASI